ncbi:MAG: hypothetical protein GX829_00115 [Clostridium sp.]|nr:hypothetical protein [Clostridium sp.]
MKSRKINYKVIPWLLMVMSIFLFTGCQGDENSILPQVNKPPVEKKEELEVFILPDEVLEVTATTKWVKDDTLHPESKLSLVSEEYNSYLMVLEDKKEDFPLDMELPYYVQLISENLKKDLEEGQISEVKDTQVTGENGKLFDVSGKDGSMEIVYKYLITEKDDSFYQVILWSSKENIETNQAYYENIIISPEFRAVSTQS